MFQIINVTAMAYCTIVQAIPGSASTDTVTIEIRRVSDNYTWDFSRLTMSSLVKTGAMTHIHGDVWSQTFRPPTAGEYAVSIIDTTIDSHFYQQLNAKLSTCVFGH